MLETLEKVIVTKGQGVDEKRKRIFQNPEPFQLPCSKTANPAYRAVLPRFTEFAAGVPASIHIDTCPGVIYLGK